jgi:hypothetical protein
MSAVSVEHLTKIFGPNLEMVAKRLGRLAGPQVTEEAS